MCVCVCVYVPVPEPVLMCTLFVSCNIHLDACSVEADSIYSKLCLFYCSALSAAEQALDKRPLLLLFSSSANHLTSRNLYVANRNKTSFLQCFCLAPVACQPDPGENVL